MPAPPARSRSASVPCGVSSTSSSLARYCRANSLFSPTYELVIREIRPASSSRPRPQPSTPQLFDTTRSPVAPPASRAAMRVDGMPQRPKPPTARLAPSVMSATASAAVTTLSIERFPILVDGEQLPSTLASRLSSASLRAGEGQTDGGRAHAERREYGGALHGCRSPQFLGF